MLRGVGGRLGENGNMYEYAESIYCPPETFTTLLIGCMCHSVVLTLCDPMDCSLPGSSVHGIFQVRILEWFAFPTLGEYKIKSFTKAKSINFVKVHFHIESKRQKENLCASSHRNIYYAQLKSFSNFLPCLPSSTFSWCFSGIVCTMQHVLCKTIWVGM